MKQTVAELLPENDEYAYIMMVWGSRRERPEEIAARGWATMAALKDAIPANDPQVPAPVWVDASQDLYGHDRPPAPSSLPAMQDQTLERADVDDLGNLVGGVRMGSYLISGETDVASYSGNVGAGRTYVGNTVTIRFLPDYPLGTEEDVLRLFRTLVAIWAPDTARFGTYLTSRQVHDYAKSYAGYMTWVSQSGMGTPPPLKSATAEPFGEGTLLTVKEWSVEGVRNLHEELLAAGVPGYVSENINPQSVPRFPSSTS
ncbi:hypothetical protein [Arthrobacter sp. zg-Y1110]|uniref:hypothetical protein n=1 Tax=Arthrobacter sp. zg-Y1110 TaxID=2886932 RepID=UPI001D15AC40|nr:hypothetical protein [Arthrobacter sp. zg-Y1110]MCC3291262.1 hypothetical protein [Arthrobacter sp. zg-Y1110]UWX83688.1 hypothetical protein N2K99_09165 [Arthrobacter sp. zg-Y1110]